MQRLIEGSRTETEAEEREALRLDLKHLQEQCDRYGVAESSGGLGGVQGLLVREKIRLFGILHGI